MMVANKFRLPRQRKAGSFTTVYYDVYHARSGDVGLAIFLLKGDGRVVCRILYNATAERRWCCPCMISLFSVAYWENSSRARSILCSAAQAGHLGSVRPSYSLSEDLVNALMVRTPMKSVATFQEIPLRGIDGGSRKFCLSRKLGLAQLVRQLLWVFIWTEVIGSSKCLLSQGVGGNVFRSLNVPRKPLDVEFMARRTRRPMIRRPMVVESMQSCNPSIR